MTQTTPIILLQAARKTLDWESFTSLAEHTIEQAIKIQQIPAPTFAEGPRGDYMKQQFINLGLEAVDFDERFNVYGVLPGEKRDRPGIMVCAHTDTVFPAETDLTIKRDGNLIYGPGLGDNSIGMAGMLALIKALKEQNLTPKVDIHFVATSREEGLGDLGGMKWAYECIKSRIWAVINLEGLSYGHVYNGGIAVRRLHITAKTGGGHSWIHFGRPSAIHAIVQLGARITQLHLPASPRTTYNIGIIEGGQSINTIAAEAGLWLDLRSTTPNSVEMMEHQIHELVASSKQKDLSFNIEVVGDRPAGRTNDDHPLVQLAVRTLEQVGVKPTLEIGSTDGNISLADGCPTVTIGITQGGNAHRIDEFIETEPVAQGLQQLTLLTLAATQLDMS